MEQSGQRLDNFTDAAFAFAVTLLVIGGTEAPTTQAALSNAVAEVPAFAIGFSFIAMFWFAHVRWRALRGHGDWLSALLTAGLVFLVLIYVQPLRAMARSLAAFLGGPGAPFRGDLGDLFLVYGAGFVAMTLATAALFLETRRNLALDAVRRASARGEAFIWLILAATGIVSMGLTRFDSTEPLAPILYATLPVTIGLFVWRFDWTGGANPPAEAGDS